MSVYLDHAAGAPLRPEALAAYVDAVGRVGNPSSVHGHGQAARAMLADARERIAAALDCEPIEVVFTSGGTESVNLAIKGAFWASQGPLLIPAGEHHATIETVDWLIAHEGASVVPLDIDSDALLQPAVLEAAVAAHPDAALISFLWANNEVGTVNDVPALASAAAGVPVHVDAVAAFGGVPVSFRASGADLISVSAHKIGGPVGIGALVVGRRVKIDALLHGGGQQRSLRAGTESPAAAQAFAVAAELAVAELAAASARVAALRDRALAGLLERVPGARLRGASVSVPGARLPGNLHMTVDGADGDVLLVRLDMAGVSVSTGSACQAGVTEVSHVLLGMGLSVVEARGALRITLGHTTTDSDIDALLAAAPTLVRSA